MRLLSTGILLALVAAAVLAAGATADPGTPMPGASPAASPTGCPVTQPNGNHPSGFSDPGGYGNEALWTNLFMWSDGPEVLVPDDGRVLPDGTIPEMKWAWYRYVPGTLTVEGRRLDAPSDPLIAWVPEGYGEIGFQVTGLTFPSAGCWEITGRVGDASLTFVTLVVAPPGAATPTIIS
jgi:hypothetical protein